MTTSAETAAPAYDAGRLIGGRFRIEEQLARGGMGVVYRAHDEHARRGVALKQMLVPPGQQNQMLEVQFEREFHTLSQLAHPCIIEVYDYGVEAGSPYYTMELLQGDDLRQRGKLPWRETCKVLRDVASALAMLHSRRLLHRDISARNVFCAHGGRAKLIDFGVMTPMGVSKQVVGTPPFVAPESLQMQALDGRADLYALGALAYWVLTGAYAYPARTLGELPALLRVPPPSVHQYAPDVPQALDELVMQLVQVDRAARPHTAAEVMERLCGIAGLDLDERLDVGKAYLITPTLVGRDEALERTQLELRKARSGEGSALLFEGPRGAGRSRMLDAAVLEAKLLGAIVLRADAGDASDGDYGVARTLCVQLHAALPEGFDQGTPSLRPQASLRPLFAQVRREFSSGQRSAFSGERRHVQAALSEWFQSVARDRHIVIAVDDVDRIDEPSAAMLGALSHGAARRKLSLLLSAQAGNTPNPAMALLRQTARAVALPALDLPQTELLMRSLFGDVPHVAALAQRVYASACGAPGWTMALVEHLVDTRVASYAAGSWALPAELHADQLPASLAQAQAARVTRLPPDARALAEALCLIDAPGPTPALYPRLTDHGDHARTYRALEVLLASGVLTVAGDRHRFAAGELRELLERELGPSRKRELHARIAIALEGSELDAQLPDHMLLGGRELEAITALQARYARSRGYRYSEPDVKLLDRAVEAAEHLGLPLHVQLELQVFRINALAVVGDRALFLRYGPPLLQRVLSDSGLLDYQRLTSGTPAERMAQARTLAAERNLALPEAQRGFPPEQTPDVLVRVYSAYVQMAGVAQELSMLEQLPSLDPLWDHVGSRVIQWYIEITRGTLSGDHARSSSQQRALLEFLDKHGADFPLGVVRSIRQMQRFVMGLFAATSGRKEAREFVAELEHEPVQRVNAWRVRMVYELMLGNAQGAAQCQRRAELLYLQDSGASQGPSVTTRIELIAHIYSDDLIGVKRSSELIETYAERYPGWRSTLAIARSQYRRLRGDAAGAFEALQPVLATTLPGRHLDWWLVAYTHVQVLTELGCADEAVSHGLSYVKTWTAGEFSAVDYGLSQVTAEALLRAGRVDEARAMIDAYIAQHVTADTHGLRLGLAYETRARVAIAQQDQEAVQLYSRFCAQEYKGGRHFGLLTKYSRLLQDADAGGISLTTGLRNALDGGPSATLDAALTLQSLLMGCIDAGELANTGLRALLQSSDVECGYLFVLRDGRLQRVAASEAGDAETEGLQQMLEHCLREELADEAVTGTTVAQTTRSRQRWRDTRGREFEAVLLSAKQAGQSVAVGMAAVQVMGDKRPVLRRALIETLASSLLAEGAADPLQLQ